MNPLVKKLNEKYPNGWPGMELLKAILAKRRLQIVYDLKIIDYEDLGIEYEKYLSDIEHLVSEGLLTKQYRVWDENGDESWDIEEEECIRAIEDGRFNEVIHPEYGYPITTYVDPEKDITYTWVVSNELQKALSYIKPSVVTKKQTSLVNNKTILASMALLCSQLLPSKGNSENDDYGISNSDIVYLLRDINRHIERVEKRIAGNDKSKSND